jgi:HK97 family phage major capsid protein
MTTSNQTLHRADIVMADLQSNGGELMPEQANTFIDYVAEQPTILRQVRVERLNSPTKKINRMGFGSRIMHKAPTSGGANDDGTNDRYLAAAKRAKVGTSQIELTTYERIVEIRIPYEVLEDNIEGSSMEAHIMRLMAEQVAIDSEEAALYSDTALSATDEDLGMENGWLKRIAAHVVDNANGGVNPDLFANAMLALPQKYLRNVPQMRAFVSEANRIKYQQRVAQRQTGYGDAALQENIPIVAHGLRVEAAPMLAADGSGTTGLVTHPKNLIWAIRRDISVETDKDIRSREYIIVLTLRSGVQVDDTDAAVKLLNI